MMRKYYIWFVLCLVSIGAAAQPRLRQPEIYVGAHAGVMASTMLFKPQVANIDILQSPLAPNGGLVFR